MFSEYHVTLCPRRQRNTNRLRAAVGTSFGPPRRMVGMNERVKYRRQFRTTGHARCLSHGLSNQPPIMLSSPVSPPPLPMEVDIISLVAADKRDKIAHSDEQEALTCCRLELSIVIPGDVILYTRKKHYGMPCLLLRRRAADMLKCYMWGGNFCGSYHCLLLNHRKCMTLRRPLHVIHSG